MGTVSVINNNNTRAYRAELNSLIAHHLGLAMVNLELAKRYWWHPWKRREYLKQSENYRQAAADLLNTYRTIWNKRI